MDFGKIHSAAPERAKKHVLRQNPDFDGSGRSDARIDQLRMTNRFIGTFENMLGGGSSRWVGCWSLGG